MARILIAPVDKNFGFILKCELEDEGHSVDLAVRTNPASDAAKNAAYDVVLFDMRMSSLDFFNRLTYVKRKNPGAHVVIFTDISEEEERASLIDAGANACFGRHEIKKLKDHLRLLMNGPH